MTTQSQLVPVSFHGDTLFIVSQDGEPFAPVRPIVEGMGIRWQSQHRKLATNQRRWSVIMMMTETKAGPREALCMPLRKLAGFLATIEPRKVRPEIRAKIELYQAECDDALWDYWTKGQAVNPRTAAPPPPVQPVLPAQATIPYEEYVGLLKTRIAFLEHQPVEKKQKRPGRPFTDADRAEILRLFAAGMSQNAISKATDRSSALINHVVRSANLGGAL